MSGRRGEALAEDYLKDIGYRIETRNFRSQQGEIDLIVWDREMLVFVEVKNYSFRSYGSPVAAVRKSKRDSIIHAARTYLIKRMLHSVNCRFDVLTIFRKSNGQKVVEHYRNAFFIR
ncbi:MAG: YraN family protein [Candidatus Saganbacteria bacterium]|nr:YraN family protein [Candidatus Saganbacteria bacterium]